MTTLSAYRIVQEALTNVARHAQATQVWVEVAAVGANTRLRVSDDGVGPPAEVTRGSGLIGIAERVAALGGVWSIGRRPGGGTIVDAYLPVAPMTIRVAVVDDQQLVREGFAMILGGQADMEVAVQAEDGRQFLDAVRADPRIDVALVDIRMPVLDGLAATRALAAIPHAPAVIVVTTFDDDAYVLDAIAAGARGFVLKRCSGRELVDAVRRVAAGDSILSPEVTGAVLARVRSSGTAGTADLTAYSLTARETDVLALVGAGLNNTEIAARLHLSLSTVKTHVSNVLDKTGSRDRVAAALLAIRAGVVP